MYLDFPNFYLFGIKKTIIIIIIITIVWIDSQRESNEAELKKVMQDDN